MLVALVIGAFFNAPAMKKTAMELPFGGQRSFRLALVDPAAAVSHWFYLDRPAKLTAVVLGKPDPGSTGAPVVVVVRPTAKPTKGEKPPKPLQDKPLPKPYAGHPMHLYIAGDSMAGIPGMALVNLSNDTHLIKPLLDYRISTGLVRPDFFNWPAQLQRQVKAFDPGAVVVMWGANDNQPVQTASGEVYQFGSDGWKREYRRRVEDAIALLFQGGVRRVYWIGQPVMPSASYNSQIKLMNDVYASVAETTPGVQYIDAYKLFSDRRRLRAVSPRRQGRDAAGPRGRRRTPHLRRRHARRPGGDRRDQEGVVPQEGRGPPAAGPKSSKSATPAPWTGPSAAPGPDRRGRLRRPRPLV